VFIEADIDRTQEFTLPWSPDGGRSYQDIVRQQWNFSPLAAIREVEEYHVELSGVTALELTIIPDQHGAMCGRRSRSGAWPDLLPSPRPTAVDGTRRSARVGKSFPVKWT